MQRRLYLNAYEDIAELEATIKTLEALLRMATAGLIPGLIADTPEPPDAADAPAS